MSITITPQNFGEVMSTLYTQVMNEKVININFESNDALEEREFLGIDSQIEKKQDYLGNGKLQTFEEAMNDPENTSYGPITMDDFIDEMKKW